jgi:transcriptional regulator with XRE-family HTH domain
LVAILACFGYNEATKRRRKTMTMGEKILNMRKARGWNQEELAERVGVTRQAVSRWEAGSAKPDADKIITICDLFGVSADYLLRDQYSGEGSAAQPEKQPVNALAEKAQSMTQQQRAAGIASAIALSVSANFVSGLWMLPMKRAMRVSLPGMFANSSICSLS